MDEGRKPPSSEESPRPTWTSRLDTPADRAITPTRPLNPDEADGLVPAADGIVTSAYGRTGMLPERPLLNRDRATDALVIQKSAREARVLNFTVDSIRWRAGFAPEVGQTPVGRHLRTQAPPGEPFKDPTGFELRPIAPEQERVLLDIVPAALLAEREAMFGRGHGLVGFYLYFFPSGTAAIAGAFAWYEGSATGRPHCLYLQTELRKADARILDEMAKTFAASAVVLDHEVATRRPFDFWREMGDARAEVRASLRDTTLSRNAGLVRERVAHARESAENRVYNVLLRFFDQLGAALAFLVVGLPQRLLAGLVRGGSLIVVRTVQTLDRALGRLVSPPAPPPED